MCLLACLGKELFQHALHSHLRVVMDVATAITKYEQSDVAGTKLHVNPRLNLLKVYISGEPGAIYPGLTFAVCVPQSKVKF